VVMAVFADSQMSRRPEQHRTRSRSQKVGGSSTTNRAVIGVVKDSKTKGGSSDSVAEGRGQSGGKRRGAEQRRVRQSK